MMTFFGKTGSYPPHDRIVWRHCRLYYHFLVLQVFHFLEKFKFVKNTSYSNLGPKSDWSIVLYSQHVFSTFDLWRKRHSRVLFLNFLFSQQHSVEKPKIKSHLIKSSWNQLCTFGFFSEKVFLKNGDSSKIT